jgi:Putative zinc finger motif, C2HC5-type
MSRVLPKDKHAKVRKWIQSQLEWLGFVDDGQVADHILTQISIHDVANYLRDFLGADTSSRQQRFLDQLVRKVPHFATYSSADSQQAEFDALQGMSVEEQKQAQKGRGIKIIRVKKKKKKKNSNNSDKESSNDSVSSRTNTKRRVNPKRRHCECQATQHDLFTNCIACGKIICDREGEGPCFSCGSYVSLTGTEPSPEFVQLMLGDHKDDGTTSSNIGSKAPQAKPKATSYEDELQAAIDHRDELINVSVV